MKKQGFTLIELLAVIAILGIIATITVPVVINAINNSKIKACEEQERVIINAAQRWSTDNINLLPLNTTDVVYVDIWELQADGYLETGEDIINPLTNESVNESVVITYDDVNNTYIYELNLGC